MRTLPVKSALRWLTAIGALTLMPCKAHAIGWPSNYEGVMLQGFYWDSYTDTKWTNLESMSDELSQYFDLIWIPNSGNCDSGYLGNNMGYMPQYWFTNHNSGFGTEEELRSMIDTFKKKGTGIIADVVINHRNGINDWYSFPVEEWNGKTWKIGLDGICKNDEMAGASGYGTATPTGGYDTGDGFDGCRDLDHTNANVQENCKNYVKCLMEDFGYSGVRYDMVKGYSGYYNGIYNRYNNVQFSVGEYFDMSYDNVANWIKATGMTSAAFDFPLKGALNSAFNGGENMSALVWKANGTTEQPAGMIHFIYPRYSVTFVENHDTARDNNKFTGNVLAANAFIIFSPGTPCIFLRHYLDNKEAIQKMIEIRKEYGIHNQSEVRVLWTSGDCYMAEVKGKRGNVVVKVGSKMISPEGYSNDEIKTSGNNYCVWAKKGANSGWTPQSLYVIGDLKDRHWNTNAGVTMVRNGNKFVAPSVALEASAGNTAAYFSIATGLGANWDAVNASDRIGASEENEPIEAFTPVRFQEYAADNGASGCKSWQVTPGNYDITVDFETGEITLEPAIVNLPDQEITVYFDNTQTRWDNVYVHYWGREASVWPGKAMSSLASRSPMRKVGSYGYYYNLPVGTTGIVFNNGETNSMAQTGDYVALHQHVYNASDDIGPIYLMTGVEDIESENQEAPVYYNLQGIPVSNPEKGIYIKVTGKKAVKVAL